jgi:translocation and assembly module TamB
MTLRTRRVLRIATAAIAAAIICICIAAALLFRSGWFHRQVRDRILAEAEKATGGRAEIGAFDFDWRTFQARVAPFTLHGKEHPGEPVLLHAASIQVGLKIVSAMEKDVDIASLTVERPEIHILVYPDGSTNLPEPLVRQPRKPIAEQILKLGARHFELRHGTLELREERIPFDIRGDNLVAVFDYDSSGPRYRGHLSSRQLHWEGRYIRPVAFDFDTDLTLDKDRLQISNATFLAGRSRLVASGALQNWADPRADFTFDSNLFMADLSKLVKIPIEPQGDANVRGQATLAWGHGFQFGADGQLAARGLAWRDNQVHIAGVGARGDFQLRRDGVTLPRLTATALGGTWEGRVAIRNNFENLEVEGAAQNFALSDVIQSLASPPHLAWSGIASGPVRIDGRIASGRPSGFTVQAAMTVAAQASAVAQASACGSSFCEPIQGNVDVIYDQNANSLRFGSTAISTPASRVTMTGTLGQSFRAEVETSNLDDLLPALALLGPGAPKQIPLKLSGGAAQARLTITGPVANPVIAGHVTLGRFEAEGRTFDSLSSDITLSENELTARNLTLAQGATQVTGAGRVELRQWKLQDANAVSASLNLRGGEVQRILAEAGHKLPISGTVNATANVSGTYGSPQAAVQLTVNKPVAYGETFDQLHATARLGSNGVEVSAGDVKTGPGRIQFTGEYRREGAGWKTGAIRFDIAGSGLTLDQFQHVRDYKTGLSGGLAWKATGAARVRNADVDLDSLDSQIALTGMTRGGAPIGNLSASARTRGGSLEAQIDGAIRGSEIHGSGRWKLEGDYPGSGEIQFKPLSFAVLHDIAAQGQIDRELPFAGTVEGHVAIAGPLKKQDALQADVILPRIEIRANPSRPLPTRAGVQDLVLRNTEPVRLVATLKAVDIRSAKFEAASTGIQAAGRVAFDAQSPWNVAVKGSVNLAILRMFNSGILATGNATLDTTVRGALADPQVNGRLELKNASLYLLDVPAGVDNANGIVTFDRSRANIEKLTAEIGGGHVAFGGFIGFSRDLLLYHVQGTADEVRLRHPDGISVTVNAALNLTGTSDNGLVSGAITVVRAAFEPRADVASIVAALAQPLPAPAPNEYLRGLNFDVRVESGPNLEIHTSLTRNVEAEAELRLRGNAARPVLEGDISVNQGEIQFLGSKYTINRGDLRFINPTRIEPVFQVDLETKARGITVNISFSGTLNKLNVSYNSDPPLQTSDIIALLAVGRDPNSAALANAQTRSNLLESGGSTLSQAVAAPVSDRLQRFFGVSRLKIDPSLTGVENIPQAHLTLEQQVSRDITLTYITNLARTQEQIVRVEWDINRKWSAVAIRDENGVFGIDFQYKRRF